MTAMAKYIGYLAGMPRADLEASRDEYREKAPALRDSDPFLARCLLEIADDIDSHLAYRDAWVTP